MCQTTLGHRLVDYIDRALDQTALIGVFNAENELAVVAAGNQPCIKRSAQVANVHIARGARSKSGCGPRRAGCALPSAQKNP